jgi:tellurite resistance protein
MTSAPLPRLTPNLFGISFGLTGLGEVWAAASRLYAAPSVVTDALFVVAAAVWVVTLAAYVRDVAAHDRWRTELRDPVFAPFTALVPIVAMLLGAELSRHARLAGELVTTVGLLATLALGGALIGQWVVEELSLAQWHPGYFIPTVAGGYLGSETMSALHHHDLAVLLFGYGSVSWLVLGSILLQRMFVESRLPTPLLPTMAIQMAPPVVAGVAWFGIDGERADALALAIAGYALLMAMVQLRLVPLFRTARFGPGWWAYSFSYAAVFVDVLHWLAAEHVPSGAAWSWLLLIVVTTAITALSVRTVGALRSGHFLPVPATVPAEIPAPVAAPAPALTKESAA